MSLLSGITEANRAREDGSWDVAGRTFLAAPRPDVVQVSDAQGTRQCATVPAWRSTKSGPPCAWYLERGALRAWGDRGLV